MSDVLVEDIIHYCKWSLLRSLRTFPYFGRLWFVINFSALISPFLEYDTRLWSRFQVLINSYYHLSPGRMLPLVIRPMTMSRHAQLKALANTACLYGPAPLYHNLLSLHRRSYLYILPLIYFVPFPRKRGRTCFLYSPQTASNRGGHSSRS